jgi:uncharacterized membrane protein YcjF (UPF0283 family)
MARIIAIVVALLALAALLTWLTEAYFASEGIELGFHGVAATFLCLVFVPGVTIGLMRLLRISQDKGFDDRADTYARDHGHRSDEA